MKKPLRWVLRIFPLTVGLMMVAAVGLALVGRIERTVEAQGQVTVHNYQIVRTPVSGQVAEVLIAGGQRVTAGQPLLRLEDPERSGRLAEAEQRLATATGTLERLRSEQGLRLEVLDPLEQWRRQEQRRQSRWNAEVAGSKRREAELDLESLERRLEQTRELSEHGLVSRREVEDARRQVSAAGERLAQRRIEEQQASATETSADIEMRLLGGEQQRSMIEIETEMRRLQGEQELWTHEVDRLRFTEELYLVRSELDGVLVSESANELLGRQVSPGDELLRVIDIESIRFVSQVPEHSVVQVRTGQSVSVELVGLPKERFRTFEGEVRFIDQRPQLDADGAPVYAVEILLENPWVRLGGDDTFYLRGGMRGLARIAYRRGMPLVDVVYEFLVGAPAIPTSGSPEHADRTAGLPPDPSPEPAWPDLPAQPAILNTILYPQLPELDQGLP